MSSVSYVHLNCGISSHNSESRIIDKIYLINWLHKVLWNCYFLIKALFQSLLLFKDHYFFKASSNVNEVIRAVLNSLFFFTKRFHTYILTKRRMWRLQIKSSRSPFSMCVPTIGECEDSCIKLRSSHLN